ncbi:hypothetical protein APSETT444_008715 [Aspergillus pseudonomiae]
MYPLATHQHDSNVIELLSPLARVSDLLGYIEPYEIIKSAKEDGFEMSDEEAKEWIDMLDDNHDGKVSFSEFIKAFGELKNKQ